MVHTGMHRKFPNVYISAYGDAEKELFKFMMSRSINKNEYYC